MPAELYQKFGRVIRYENGVFVRVDEAGEAIEDGDTFSCRPVRRSIELPEINATRIENVANEIRGVVQPPLQLERLVMIDGVAEHRFGDRAWRDETHRVHAAITFRSFRVLIDDVTDLREIAEALPKVSTEREAARIRLAPNVAAALLPSLRNMAPPNVRLRQMAGGVDGKGNDVVECDASGAPNWYRPTYRARPLRMPLNLRATCEVKTIDEDVPRAIALLAPVDRLLLRVLCTHRGDVFPATVRVARIDAISDDVRFFPYGAGSFGAEMML